MFDTSSLKSYIYDALIPNTKYMYEKVLTEKIPDGSRILEVGIGNGNCLAHNAALIKRKKLTIVGIDIDSEYLTICQRRIKEYGISSNVSCHHQDLLEMNDDDYDMKFDFVLFMESYPVIPIPMMEKMVQKSKSLLGKKGKILFVHNLVESKNPFIEFVKPLIVDFTTVDFGRLTSHSEMKRFLERCQVKNVRVAKIYDAYLSEAFPFLRLKLPPCIDHHMEQFVISASVH